MSIGNITNTISKADFSKQIIEALDEVAISNHRCSEYEIYCFSKVGSTMDVAREVLKEEGLYQSAGRVRLPAVNSQMSSIIVAEEQSAGRGREQRNWWSKHGSGIFVTFAFKLGISPDSLLGVSLAVGLAVKRAVSYFGATDIEVKWPNDVVIDDPASVTGYKKLAGILCEAPACSPGKADLLIGIGLNLVADEYPEDVTGISLAQLTTFPFNFASVFSILCAEVSSIVSVFLSTGLLSFSDEWMRCSFLKDGKTATVRVGDSCTTGTVCGLGKHGELLLKADEGEIKAVSCGEVE